MVQSLPTSVAPFRIPPANLRALPPLVLAREHSPINVSWPRVGEGTSAAQVTAQRGKKLAPSPASALLDALDELLSVREPHAAFRVAVELSRDRLGLREPALLLVDETGEYVCGTWRAAPDGSLQDEREVFLKLGLLPREAEARARDRSGAWTVFSEEVFPHAHPNAGSGQRPAWIALTPIFGRDRLIGFLENRGADGDGEPQDAVQIRAALLCRALSGLLDDTQRRAQSLPWGSLLTRPPSVPSTPRQSLVAKVVLALHDDASVASRTLAVKLGVSTSHLSSVFHEQMGLSLTRYRNRLRIERFFTECDPCGGNLLQAAFQAGFGSYPQFHRVFRELLDATPRDYLSP